MPCTASVWCKWHIVVWPVIMLFTSIPLMLISSYNCSCRARWVVVTGDRAFAAVVILLRSIYNTVREYTCRVTVFVFLTAVLILFATLYRENLHHIDLTGNPSVVVTRALRPQNCKCRVDLSPLRNLFKLGTRARNRRMGWSITAHVLLCVNYTTTVEAYNPLGPWPHQFITWRLVVCLKHSGEWVWRSVERHVNSSTCCTWLRGTFTYTLESTQGLPLGLNILSPLCHNSG